MSKQLSSPHHASSSRARSNIHFFKRLLAVPSATLLIAIALVMLADTEPSAYQPTLQHQLLQPLARQQPPLR